MTGFLLAAAALTLVVLAAALLPLLRRAPAPPEREAFDRAVYRDQLRELERDTASGMIAPAEAAAARLEIQRRLLAHARAAEAPAPSPLPSPTGSGRTPALAALLALLVAGGAAGFYVTAGAPGLPAMPLAGRTADPEALRLREAMAELERRVADEPGNAGAWLLLARTRSALGLWQPAVAAFQRAFALAPPTPDMRAAALEAEVLAGGGTIAPAALQGFSAVLTDDPDNPVARFYLAEAAAQAGRHAEAIAAWQALAAALPADSPIRAEAARRIAATARGAGIAAPPLPPPTAEPSAEERAAMIRGMVERLATRLESEPDDAEGWARLGRAYAVLGERERANQAYARASALRPDDMEIALAEAQALLDGLPPTAPFPPRAADQLRRVLAADPQQPAALWHLGVEAAKRGAMDEAAGFWDRLIAVLPEDSEDARMVRAALQAVRRR